MLDDDFSSIVQAVKLGRRIYDNIRKALAYILAIHVPQDTHILQRATYLLLIASRLERAADHCTNICKRIVFIIEGETSMQPLLEQ